MPSRAARECDAHRVACHVERRKRHREVGTRIEMEFALQGVTASEIGHGRRTQSGHYLDPPLAGRNRRIVLQKRREPVQRRQGVVTPRMGTHQVGKWARHVVKQTAAVIFRHVPFGSDADRVAAQRGVGSQQGYRLGVGVERFVVHLQGRFIADRQHFHIEDALFDCRAYRDVAAVRSVTPAVDQVEFGRDGSGKIEAAEKIRTLGFGGEIPRRDDVVVTRFVAFEGDARRAFVDIPVAFLAVERAGVVERSAQRVTVGRGAFPAFLHAPRSGRTLVVLARIARVVVGVEPCRADVHRQQVGRSAPFESFADIEQLAAQIRFEAGFEVAASLLALDLDQSAGQIAVFDRRNALLNLYRSYFIGRHRAHVDASVQ